VSADDDLGPPAPSDRSGGAWGAPPRPPAGGPAPGQPLWLTGAAQLFETYRQVASALFEPQSRVAVAEALAGRASRALGATDAVVLLERSIVVLTAPARVADEVIEVQPRGPAGSVELVAIGGTAPLPPADLELGRHGFEAQEVIGPVRTTPLEPGSPAWRVVVPLSDTHGPHGAAVFRFEHEPRDDAAGGWFEALAFECREAMERARLWEVKLDLRRQAERHSAEIAASERRLRRVLDGLFLFVGLLSPDGTLLEANRVALEAGGLQPDDVLGRRFWDTYWWSHSKTTQARLRDAVARAAAGIRCRFDAELRMADGRLVILDFQVAPLWDDDGNVSHLVPSGLDITERKAQEVEREQRLVEEQLARERAEAMQQLAEALGSATDSAEVADAVVDNAARAVGAATATLAEVSDRPDVLELRTSAGLPPEVVGRWPEMRADLDTAIAAAYRTGRVAWAADPASVAQQFPASAPDAEALGLRAIGAVPIINAHRQVAAVIGFTWRHDQPLTSALQASMTSLAAMVGQALERARRFDVERHVADALQQVLLPASLPYFDTLGLTARYLAAESMLAVGGDWYECFEPEPGRLVLALGDVVGRGLEAAAAVGQLRAAVAALATTSATPGVLLDRLDEFVRHFPAAECTTVVCVELSLADGSFRYACAGHPPPLLIRADGTTTMLDGGRSTPLGITAGPRPVATHRLDEGDRLLLYTDGLVERRGERIDAGFERLRGAVDAGIAYGSDNMLIDEVLERTIPASSSDDVCLLLVHRRRAPSDLAVAVHGGASGLAGARHELRAWLEAAGADSRTIEETVLAAGEALGNAIEHAYLGRAGEPVVALDATLRATTIELVVRDKGHWREVAAPGPRGRGLMLMRRIMDEVVVQPSAMGTRVIMRRTLEDDT
jgi:PAS domain S-box-containing protein